MTTATGVASTSSTTGASKATTTPATSSTFTASAVTSAPQSSGLHGKAKIGAIAGGAVGGALVLAWCCFVA